MGQIDAISEAEKTVVTGTTSQGIELHATVRRLSRHMVVFGIHNPALGLRLSEVLNEFKIRMDDQVVYSGRAVVSGMVDVGTELVCEATLEEGWLDFDFPAVEQAGARLRAEFDRFIKRSEKSLRIVPDFKRVVADLQILLMDLRQWLDQVELGIRALPSGDRLEVEQSMAREISPLMIPYFDGLFGRFEEVAVKLDESERPAHQSYVRRQLHPLLLCAPFVYRTFYKPLGYAGDYEMVNMILRDSPEGGSLFAKVVNGWFIAQAPAAAHRNRVKHLTQRLTEETARAIGAGREARILNVGCGPAGEVQDLMASQHLSDRASFVLIDFNEETLEHGRRELEAARKKHGRTTPMRFVKKSVQQILKEAARAARNPAGAQYDLVYCAGLFDYLPDAVCAELMKVFYGWRRTG